MREVPGVSGPVWQLDPNGQFPTEFQQSLPIVNLPSEGRRRGPINRGRVLLKNSITNFGFLGSHIISNAKESVNFEIGYGFT